MLSTFHVSSQIVANISELSVVFLNSSLDITEEKSISLRVIVN